MILCDPTTLFGHEEPNKTLHEKKQASMSRERIANARIRSMTQWKHEIADGGPTGKKSRAIDQEFDAHGRLLIITAFKADTVSESATYSYNLAGDMISDIDLSGTGIVTKANLFLSDAEGRVLRGYSYDGWGVMTGRFEHTFDVSHRKILFSKFTVHDSLEYTIESLYAGDYDTCDYTRAIKRDAAGTELMHVEKLLDASGMTKEKRVVQGEKKIFTGFRYTYTPDGIMDGVVKINEAGEVGTTTRYRLNADGTYAEVQTTDRDGTLISMMTFEYGYTATVR